MDVLAACTGCLLRLRKLLLWLPEEALRLGGDSFGTHMAPISGRITRNRSMYSQCSLSPGSAGDPVGVALWGDRIVSRACGREQIEVELHRGQGRLAPSLCMKGAEALHPLLPQCISPSLIFLLHLKLFGTSLPSSSFCLHSLLKPSLPPPETCSAIAELHFATLQMRTK